MASSHDAATDGAENTMPDHDVRRARELLQELRKPESRDNRRWMREVQLGEVAITHRFLDTDTIRAAIRVASADDGMEWLYRQDVLADDVDLEARLDKRRREETTTAQIQGALSGAGALAPPRAPEEPDSADVDALLRWEQEYEAYTSSTGFNSRRVTRWQHVGKAVLTGQSQWRREALYLLFLSHRRDELFSEALLAEDAPHDPSAQEVWELAGLHRQWTQVIEDNLSGGADQTQSRVLAVVSRALVILDPDDDPEGGDVEGRTRKWGRWIRAQLARDQYWRELRAGGYTEPQLEPLAEALALRALPPA